MKIVSLFESIKIGGGVENVQSTLSRGLVDLGYDFTHLVLEDKVPRNEYKGKIVSLNEKFIFGFGIKKIISMFKIGYKVSKYCKKENIDVILGQGDFFYMIVSVSKIFFGNKSKCIGVVHTTIGIWPNIIKKVLIFLLKRLDKVVLISKEEYNTFINKYGFNEKKLELIYNPIDFEIISEKLDEDLPKDYESLFNNGRFTFINVGRLTYQKNQKMLIEAFDEFFKQNKNSQLIILGDGELKEELISLKNSLQSRENIYFLGKQENIFPFLRRSDCFVLSSLFEGFGLVLIEAMISGLPIISTKCPSGPIEILSGSNNNNFEITGNAILIKNSNKEEMFISMKKIYFDNNLKNYISNNNLKNYKKYDKKLILNRWDIFIHNL